MLNSILVSDLSTARWRGISWNLVYLPYFITASVSGFVVEKVVQSIGWRWGIGSFAILLPVSAVPLTVMLFVLQRHVHGRAWSGFSFTESCVRSMHEFCSRIDLGGLLLLSGGFGLLLVPISLAATTRNQWKTTWVDALMALGVLALVTFYPYEKYHARHPVVRVEYFHAAPIVLGVMIGSIDNTGFSATHTYLYAWAMMTHNLSPRNAQFLTSINGIMQCIMGMVSGGIMYKTRAYKWLGVTGAVIRLVGYSIMIQFRTVNGSLTELFLVQVVQGIGSGILETVVVVAAQLAVPHEQLSQITSLVLLGNFLGCAIGAAVAGGIYTGTLAGRLRVLLGAISAGDGTTNPVDVLPSSSMDYLPPWGTRERAAVNQAVWFLTMSSLPTWIVC